MNTNTIFGEIGNRTYARWPNAFPNTYHLQIQRNTEKICFELKYKKKYRRNKTNFLKPILGEFERHTPALTKVLGL